MEALITKVQKLTALASLTLFGIAALILR